MARVPRVTAVVVRPSVPADAEALGRCHLECWREAYGSLVDPARLAPFLTDVDGAVKLGLVRTPDPAAAVANLRTFTFT